MCNEEIQEKVKEILTEYLMVNSHRKTPERFAILRQAYTLDGHFSVDELYDCMQALHYPVSKTTIYATLDLLEEAGLVIKHAYLKATTYERTYGIAPHYHVVCTICGKFMERTDKSLALRLSGVKIPRFKTNVTSLYFYGVCTGCRLSQARKEKKLNSNKAKE